MDLSFKLSDNSKKLEKLVKDTNASFADIGSFDGIGSYEMECKNAKLTCPSKLFLKDILYINFRLLSNVRSVSSLNRFIIFSLP